MTTFTRDVATLRRFAQCTQRMSGRERRLSDDLVGSLLMLTFGAKLFADLGVGGSDLLEGLPYLLAPAVLAGAAWIGLARARNKAATALQSGDPATIGGLARAHRRMWTILLIGSAALIAGILWQILTWEPYV